MKKIIALAVLLSTAVSFAQKAEKSSIFDRKHEVKIGAIKMLAGPVLEGTYEYIHSKDFTYGASLLINLQDDNGWNEDFSITPFARFYFQESKEYGAQGFFVEGFAKYSTGATDVYDDTNFNFVNKNYSAGTIGLSLGKKWINSSGFVFEILGGVGRTLGNSDLAPEAFFRGDFNIGYRF